MLELFTQSYLARLIGFIMLYFRSFSVFLIILLAGGCSGSSGKLIVKGVVTFKGSKLSNGNIQFFPLEAGKGESAGTLIKDGVFEVPSVHGLIPGKYKVVISCAEEVKNPPINFKGSSPPTEEKLPPQFSSFEKSLQIVEVTSQGKNFFEFMIP